MRIAFPYYGGKFSHLSWLLPLLPYTKHYCESFGGSAAVLINRERSPIETYNDADGQVVTFFRVLRDDPDDLMRLIALTPYSRQEFIDACEHTENVHNVEVARRFFVKVKQSFLGKGQKANSGYWGHSVGVSRHGISQNVARWLKNDDLAWVAQRFATVQIENDIAVKVIDRYDSDETTFYCDPPYPMGSRKVKSGMYRYEMDDDGHRNLSELLHSVAGKVAISSYRSGLMEELYGDWRSADDEPRTMRNAVGDQRTETLWMNYDAKDARVRIGRRNRAW